jgi:hypothetical protein
MNDEQRTEPAGDRHEQQKAATVASGPTSELPIVPPGAVPVESLPIPQRLQMIEQALAGLALGLQNAASREGVSAAIKAVEEKIEEVGGRLKAFQEIVTESLSLATRLDGIDRAVGEVQVEIRRLPTVQQLAAVGDSAGQIQGAQTLISSEIGRLRDTLSRMLRGQRWQVLGLLFVGAGVMLAGVALLILALGARLG